VRPGRPASDDPAVAAPALRRDLVWYAVAAASYIVAGVQQKVLLTWLVGPTWLVTAVWLGPILTGRITAWRRR
jgi:hypothetical protein